MKSVLWTIAAGLLLAGCEASSDVAGPPPPPLAASHDHAADDQHGPHDGCLTPLSVPDYQAEWIHDEQSGKITVFLLDAEAKHDVAVDAPELIIDLRIGERQNRYRLPGSPTDPRDPDSPRQYEIIDRALLEAIKVGSGVQATLRVPLGDTEGVGQLEYHRHDHGHEH